MEPCRIPQSFVQPSENRELRSSVIPGIEHPISFLSSSSARRHASSNSLSSRQPYMLPPFLSELLLVALKSPIVHHGVFDAEAAVDSRKCHSCLRKHKSVEPYTMVSRKCKFCSYGLLYSGSTVPSDLALRLSIWPDPIQPIFGPLSWS